MPPQRLLIIRPSALGDVARTVPCLAALRAAYPHARIDWLVDAGFEPLIAAHPAFASGGGGAPIAFPKNAIKQNLRSFSLSAWRTFAHSLRAADYDLVIDLQGLARSGLIARATAAPRRIGFSNARELAWLAYTERHPLSPDLHTVDRMLGLLSAAGIATPAPPDMRLYTPPGALDALHAKLPAPLQMKQADHAWRGIVLAPTSRWPAKQWPADRFARLAAHLVAQGHHVVFVGAASERPQIAPCTEFARGTPHALDLVGNTTLPELMALIESASLVVANDSAALHIAVGFSRPLVALFGPTIVSRVGPYRRESDVIQHITPADNLRPGAHKDPASASLMQRITLDEVLEACNARLASTPPTLLPS